MLFRSRGRAACGLGDSAAAAWVTDRVRLPRERLDPPPLLTGDDVLAAGVPAGRAVGRVLDEARSLQLDGVLATAPQARAWLASRPRG